MKNSTNKQEEFLKALMLAAKDKVLLEAFLADLLTVKERNALPKRWEIIRRLHQGENQWSIAGDLKIGIGTVTRGSQTLKNPTGGFRKILKLLQK